MGRNECSYEGILYKAMRLICDDFSELKKLVITQRKKIIMFGAGVIGQVAVPKLLEMHGLIDAVECYLDNDKSKWGTYIEICGRKLRVNTPDYLLGNLDEKILLINISRYADAINQLETMLGTDEIDCYVMPMALIHNFCLDKSTGCLQLSSQPLIRKKIHYIWLGYKAIPDNLKRCIETWYKFCPEYEIVEWNEDNYDIGKHPYMKEAYEHGAYGFVPDYARLDILYNEGGIYLDTDVELVRNLDPLLYQEAFCGVEKWQVVNFGGCSGSVKGNPMIKKFLDARANIHFIDSEGRQNRNTCGFYDTKVILDDGYVINGTSQNINGMNIYAYDYFHPYDYMSGITNVTDNTYSIHHFNGGWMDEEMKKQNEIVQKQYHELYGLCIKN